MFENDLFENWLDTKSKELVTKIGNQEKLSSDEMIILVLKAQSNHFYHLDQDMRKDMKELRDDFQSETKKLREDMDKRFEQVDKRFEQVDKRFDTVIARMDRFMIWSLGLTMSSTIFIIGFMYNFMK